MFADYIFYFYCMTKYNKRRIAINKLLETESSHSILTNLHINSHKISDFFFVLPWNKLS